jgi:hypothetical protein
MHEDITSIVSNLRGRATPSPALVEMVTPGIEPRSLISSPANRCCSRNPPCDCDPAILSGNHRLITTHGSVSIFSFVHRGVCPLFFFFFHYIIVHFEVQNPMWQHFASEGVQGVYTREYVYFCSLVCCILYLSPTVVQACRSSGSLLREQLDRFCSLPIRVFSFRVFGLARRRSGGLAVSSKVIGSWSVNVNTQGFAPRRASGKSISTGSITPNGCSGVTRHYPRRSSLMQAFLSPLSLMLAARRFPAHRFRPLPFLCSRSKSLYH